MKVKRTLGLFCITWVFVLYFCACAHPATSDIFIGEKGTIRIAGGTAHIPVMKDLAKLILKVNPEIQISIAGGGSGIGIKQVGEGLIDIGNSGREPTREEIERYSLKVFMWALDGVAIIVNPRNPIRSLTKEQVKSVFSGEIDNWQSIGGPDKPIKVYTRDEASGTREVFVEKGLDKGKITEKAYVVVSNGAMRAAISQDPYGIGYVSLGHLDNTVKAVAIDGVQPSIQAVKEGKYKIVRGLYSCTKGEPKGLTKKFIDFLFGPEAISIIRANGFIPVKK